MQEIIQCSCWHMLILQTTIGKHHFFGSTQRMSMNVGLVF